VPPWRAELTEKVRAIRARRNGDPQTAAVAEQLAGSLEADSQASTVAVPLPEPTISYSSSSLSSRKPISRSAPVEQIETPVAASRRTSSNIVEAALIRVKRASENASRAALPKIEPARTMSAGTQVAMAIDRSATARALEPAPEVESRPEPEPTPKPEPFTTQFSPPERIETPAYRIETPTPRAETAAPRIETTSIRIDSISTRTETVSPRVETTSPLIEAASSRIERAQPNEKSAVTSVTVGADLQTSPLDVEPTVLPLDEIEPVDYLEAEIRKVDQAYGAAFLRNESPSVLIHAVIFAVDVFSLAASCAPFLAIISIADGNFASSQTRITSFAVVAVISFFYLILTQGLCGRTFGMMLTNTRIVDAGTFEAPPATRALARTAGYFIAAVPAMLGFLWVAFNRRRRSWPDFISGTIVVRDF
jgi:uncharacterized RDD family membrane protein YckC